MTQMEGGRHSMCFESDGTVKQAYAVMCRKFAISRLNSRGNIVM